MKDKLLHIRTSSVLRLSFFLLLLGYALKFLNGEGPFSILNFEETVLNQSVGILFLSFSILIWLRSMALTNSIAIISLMFLFVDSLTSFQHAGYVPEQLIEHATKLFLPLLIVFKGNLNWNRRKTELFLKITVALTFIGHGLFAVGWHYVPGNFHAMTTSILGISGNDATIFLFVIGILDFVFATCLFLPKSFRKTALVYLICWGLITALARTVFPIADGQWDLFSVYNGLIGTIYRIPHGLLPLLLFAYAHRNAVNLSGNRIAAEF